MSGQTEFATIYRSMDTNARDESEAIEELLTSAGLSPIRLDDRAEGVPDGVHEVRVPAGEQARAEEILAANSQESSREPDLSPGLDLSEPIFHSEGSTTAEFEAVEIQKLLETNGIPAIIVGDSVLPNLPFEVRVSKGQIEQARQLIAEYEAGGSDAAEEAANAAELPPA